MENLFEFFEEDRGSTETPYSSDATDLYHYILRRLKQPDEDDDEHEYF